jgi:hypothetical protein
MPLLADIQTALMSDQPIGPILLKLRFLAARLGSSALEGWVKHESEGYPKDEEIPDYRKMPISYIGNFLNLQYKVSDYLIPPMMIAKVVGEDWLMHSESQSISAIESLIAGCAKGGPHPQVPRAANLAGLLSNKVLTGMQCTSVRGVISPASLIELQHVLRNRLLELTLQVEAKIPGVTLIEVAQGTTTANPKDYAMVTNNITNNIVSGNQANNSISNVSGEAVVSVNIQQGDAASLRSALTDIGFTEDDASELAGIVDSEKPESSTQPIGKKATAWIASNIGKVVEKVSIATAASVITKAIASYYGLA